MLIYAAELTRFRLSAVAILLAAYSQDPCTDFYDQYVKWRRFSRKDVPFGGLKNKVLHFDPIFPQNANFWPFLQDWYFPLEKALTVGMLTYKLPLIVWRKCISFL